jgi:preprotein translocase subunit SecB
MKSRQSALQLRELLFDSIRFERTGSKNDKKLKEELSAQIGENKAEGLYKIVLSLKFWKEDEYEGDIVLHGIFSFESGTSLDEKMKSRIIRENTVSIMMPYIRSELTLLTSQPGVEAVVLPPFNIRKMLSDQEKAD